MNNPFDILIYLDENLVRNLSSLVLSGYIDTRIQKRIRDAKVSEGVHLDSRNGSFQQETEGKNEREGYRDENKGNLVNAEQHNQVWRDFNGTGNIRLEEEIRRTYTTFVLNGNLNNFLQNGEILHSRNDINILNDEVESGELVEITGQITNQSLLCYVETLIALLDAIGCENLDPLLDKEKYKFINFSVLLKLLNNLKGKLILNNTQDLVMKTGDCTNVLTVNMNNFMNNDYNIFDKINCECKVIGKVVKTCCGSECINFLRKTGTEKFYEDLLIYCDSLLGCLKDQGIMVPERPCCKLENKGIQLMPISISI
ncbi:hypothetical protein [Clostridium taeniosporum]|uniref:Uncharacterized protein n=1 Tax=Clostridium taeniosporum TaxID=394958 RepID=A0A1D7XMA4_9CLOT|nr:hypothetical protein [Clostridium taeniosporum]AOR24239.1 hypothetical protein BGI42_11070 [Clostridium taeniosporum]